jgi:hypothetical protein
MPVKAACLFESHDIKLFYTIKLGRNRRDTRQLSQALFAWPTGLKMRRI